MPSNAPSIITSSRRGRAALLTAVAAVVVAVAGVALSEVLTRSNDVGLTVDPAADGGTADVAAPNDSTDDAAEPPLDKTCTPSAPGPSTSAADSSEHQPSTVYDCGLTPPPTPGPSTSSTMVLPSTSSPSTSSPSTSSPSTSSQGGEIQPTLIPRVIDLAGSGTIRVGMVGNELVLDSVSPAESWETVGRFVHPERVEVSFESAQGDVVGAVVELVDGRAVVRVADTRTGEEETMFLDDLDPLTVEID